MSRQAVPAAPDLLRFLQASNLGIVGGAVSGATNTNPVIIATLGAHGFNTGGMATVSGILGNAAANGTWEVSVIDATHFSIPIAGNGGYAGGGIATLIDFDLQGKCDDAVAEFESRTAYKPFLQTSSALVTKYLDPPGPTPQAGGAWSFLGGDWVMQLRGGLIALSGLTLAGGAFIQNTQFWLRPYDAVQEGQPYTSVQFIVPVYGAPQAIGITGIWGYCAPVALSLPGGQVGTGLPEDVFQAMLNGAAAMCSEVPTSMTGAVSQFTNGPVSQTFSADPLGKAITRWQDKLDKTVRRYCSSVAV